MAKEKEELIRGITEPGLSGFNFLSTVGIEMEILMSDSSHVQVEVNGKNATPLYKFLKSEKGGIFGDGIKWNFTKFLVDRTGKVVDRYAPTTSPSKIEVPSSPPSLQDMCVSVCLCLNADRCCSSCSSCRRTSRNFCRRNDCRASPSRVIQRNSCLSD